MLAMKPVRLQLGELLAADPTTLAPAADANVVFLIMEPFVPDEEMVIGDVTPANFTGSTPLEAGVGTQQVGTDPATSDQRVTVKEPAGGWRWEPTNDVNLPQTIYGYGLATDGLADLLGLALLDEPVTLTEAGQEINLGVVSMTINASPIA